MNNDNEKTPTQNLDIEKYRIPQNYQDICDVQQELVTVEIKRPPKSQFVSFHPDKSMRLKVAVYEDKINHRVYIVSNEILNALEGEWKAKLLVPYLIRGGSPAFWAISLPDESGTLNSWPRSAMQIVDEYPDTWMRVKSNMDNASYEILRPLTKMDPAEWRWDRDELWSKVLQQREIDSLEHPVIKELLGA